MTFVHGNYLIDVGCVLVWSLNTCGVHCQLRLHTSLQGRNAWALLKKSSPLMKTANNYSSTLFSINA